MTNTTVTPWTKNRILLLVGNVDDEKKCHLDRLLSLFARRGPLDFDFQGRAFVHL